MSSKEEINGEPSLIGDTTKFDTNPVQIDLNEFRQIDENGCTRYNDFMKYAEGLYVRKKVAKKLKGSTSVELINLKDIENTKDWTEVITPSKSFLVGLFSDYLREMYRPIRGPEWLQETLNDVSKCVVDSITPVHSDANGFAGLYSVINNQFSTVGLYSMVENMDNPFKMRQLHRAVCNLKEWLEEHENLYIDKICDYLGQYKGRWFRVEYGSTDMEDDRDVCPTIRYGDETILVKVAYCKIGGAASPNAFRYKEPIVPIKGTPIFYIGYKKNSNDISIQVYPVIDNYRGIQCRTSYCDENGGHERRKNDRMTILKEDLAFPTALKKLMEKKLFNKVFIRDSNSFENYVPPKE